MQRALLNLIKMKNKFRKNRGFGLVEIVIGAAIISIGILAVSTSYTVYVQYALSNQKNVEAVYIIEEGIEAMKFLRDMGWDGNIAPLSTATTYYLEFNGSYWATTTIPQYVDGQFLRSINISDVMRDGSDRISASGTLDPDTKQITSTVSYWQGHSTTTRSMSTYISNIRD